MMTYPLCAYCGAAIHIVSAAATSTGGEVWLHVERQPWHGDFYDHRAHNAVPMKGTTR